MKDRKQQKFYLTVIVLSIFLVGCSNSKPTDMVNEIRLSSDEISDLIISYDEENKSRQKMGI